MVKINISEQSGGPASPIVELGEAVTVFASHSKSSPGSFHFTFVLKRPVIFKRFGGEVTILCTCLGFQNHRKCWHHEHAEFLATGDADHDYHDDVLGYPASPEDEEESKEFQNPIYCKHLDILVQRNEGVRWLTCVDCNADFVMVGQNEGT